MTRSLPRSFDSRSGLGRQDRAKSFSLGAKDLYGYPLRKWVRDVLCAALPQAQQSLAQSVWATVDRSQNSQDWAEQEFRAAKLNDERLNRRLLILARDFYDRP